MSPRLLSFSGPVTRVPEHVGRIEYIDGLRALAVLAVLASHIATHAPNFHGLVSHGLNEGAHGVDLFFVLSGFCLAYPTLLKWPQRTGAGFGLSDFATKRLVRIVPPYYIAAFLFLAVALVGHFTGHASVVELPSAPAFVKSLLFLDEHVQLLNGSFWTLMVEFRWYFLFPLLLLVWLKSPRAFCAIGVASAVLFAFTRARGLDLGTLPGFMLGIIAADIHAGARMRGDLAAVLKRFALPLAVVCAGVGIAVESGAMIPGFDGADVAFPYQPTIAGWQLAAFFLVVGAGALPWLRRLLSMRFFVATGVASYAIYLVHEPIVTVVVGRFGGFTGFALAAAAALAAGFAFWAYAERPFTTGSLRKPLLDRIKPIVERCFVFLGVPQSAALPGKYFEPEAVPVMPIAPAAEAASA